MMRTHGVTLRASHQADRGQAVVSATTVATTFREFPFWQRCHFANDSFQHITLSSTKNYL